MLTVILILVAAILVAGITFYNRLIRSRNRVDTAWSDIDVQLQRRHDLIPNLVARSISMRTTSERRSKRSPNCVPRRRRDSDVAGTRRRRGEVG